MKKGWLFLIFVFTFCFLPSVYATVPLPEDVTVETLVSGFRDDFSAKIMQVTSNYAPDTLTDNRATFKATTAFTCNDGTLQPVGAQVVRIDRYVQLEKRDGAEELVEKLVYWDCSNTKVAFSETVITDGTKLTPLAWPQIFLGFRTFALSANQTKRVSIFADENRRPFIEVTSIRHDLRIDSSFIFFSRLVANVIEIDGDDVSQLFYRLLPYTVNETIGSSSIGASISGPVSTFSITASQDGLPIYRETSPKPTSKFIFLQDLSSSLLTETIASMQATFDIYLLRFPATQLVSTAAQNQRLILELNLAITQLTSGVPANINQVTIYLRSLLDAINNGQVDVNDHRPKN